MGNLAKYLPYLLELGAAAFLLLTFAFISWTKIALGAALAAVGAFFPHSTSDKASGAGALKLGGVTVTLKGSLRVGVVVAGLALIVTEGFESAQMTKRYKTASEESAAAISELFVLGKRGSPQNSGPDFSMPPAERIEKLIELKANLQYMQLVKPDPKVGTMLASVENLLRSERFDEGRVAAPSSGSSR